MSATKDYDIRKTAKAALKEFLYAPFGRGLKVRGSLTCAAKELGVTASTIRNWAVTPTFMPSRVKAKMILVWVKSKPKFVDRTGAHRRQFA